MKIIVPSWLVAGGWLANAVVAESLGWAAGIELLLFSFEGEDKRLFLSELPGLAGLSDFFSMSVHLPDKVGPEDEELIQKTRPFAVAYIVHPPRDAGDLEPWAGLVSSWRARYGDDFILEYTGEAEFKAAELALPGLPLCPDTGRLLIEGLDPASWIAQRADRVREIHLHGCVAGLDHRPFHGDEGWLRALAPFLSSFEGRVELEIFSLSGVEAAKAALGPIS